MNQRTKGLLLATGLAAFILVGSALGILGPVLPVYAQIFGYDTSTVSWLLSLFWTGSLAAVAAIYVMPTRLGPRTGLVLSALGTALLALMVSWEMVLAGALIFGFGYGVLVAVYNPRILAAFGTRGLTMVSLMNATFTIGAIAAPQVFVLLGQDSVTMFWLITAFACVILSATFAMGDTREPPKPKGTAPLRLDWRILAFATVGIGMEASFVGLGPTALIRAGQTQESAAQLLSMFFVAFLLARLSLVFIAHRVPPFGIYAGAMTMLAFTCAAALWGDVGFWFPSIGFACGFFFHGGFMTGLQRMGATTQVSAVLLGVGMIGAIVFPSLIAQFLGDMGDRGFFQIMMASAAVLTLISAAMVPRMVRG